MRLEVVSQMTVYARADGDPRQIMAALRQQVARVDPNLVISDMRTLDDQLNQRLRNERMLSFLSSGFALLATLLAGVGLYAVLATAVRHRHREIAIRIAVGATPWRIRRLVVAEAVMLAGIGAAAGVVGAVVVARLGGEALPGAAADDPIALAIAVGVLLAIAALAAYWPIRAATRVDPIVSLRA
jgi:ABC-type antimicrobial peptide transport system permease subunit